MVMDMRRLIVAIVSILAISAALWKLNSASDGVEIVRSQVGTTPVTIFKLKAAKPGPVIVIAHGFAGSQQLMQPFALTFARNGYVAITFDFLGHGRNPEPLPGGLTDQNSSLQALLNQLAEVASFAQKLPSGDHRLGILGHSMASDIVIRYAEAHAEIDATIAVSVFSPVATAISPRNLLIIDGALEPSFLKAEGKRIVGLATNEPVQERVTYGDYAKGTARRLVFAEGVEHIGVLYSGDSMVEALSWVNKVFSRAGDGFTDVRGPWLGLLYLGLILLAWPLSAVLPMVCGTPRGRSYVWRQLVPVAIVPAILTPLALWKLPTDFFPLLLGDYLAMHFGLYGILATAGLWLTRRPGGLVPYPRRSIVNLAIASTACTGYSIVAIGLPATLFVTSLALTSFRLPFFFLMLAGTLPYFLADEWSTRGATAAKGGYAFTKICFLASLAIAIALNLQKLFFLIIIVPAILVLFVVYGLFSSWAYRRTNHPFAGAICAAVTFAWAIAVTFPVVGR